MNQSIQFVAALGLISILTVSAQAAHAPARKPKVMIIATGGTIAGKQAAPGDYGYTSGAFKVEDLINAVPGVKDLADISGEQIVNIGSQDMNDAVWLKLAKRINEVAKKGDVDGIV